MSARLVATVLAVALAAPMPCGCRSGPLEPATLDTRYEQCASCRMTVSNARLASQVVAPGELPRFFDDLRCLADFLRAGKAPPGAVVFVADHRTKSWVRADRAVYTKVPWLDTPMASHVIAHADAASRDADVDVRDATPMAAGDVFGTGVALPTGDAP